MAFPVTRMRRLRRSRPIRDLVAQTSIDVGDLIAPIFVNEALEEPRPIESLPGISQHTVASAIKEAERLAEAGVGGVMLFGIPKVKDAVGSQAWAADGVVQIALRSLRERVGESLVIFADLCLDEYTDHGHCGVLDQNGLVDNDRTLELYQLVAAAQAEAGVDFVAPSGMMDGQVAAIRSGLDSHGRSDVGILAYSAKYASALYGPFRDAVEVTIAGGGDRQGYQQDYRNVRESVREVELDIAEGADMVMVKPGLAYLDVIAAVRALASVPVVTYHTSGEYSMVKAAAERGWIDGEAVALEHLCALKRAGSDVIITYFAGEATELLG